MPDLLAVVASNKEKEMDLCGKLILYSILKQAKKPASEQAQQEQKVLNEALLADANELALRLYAFKAFIARGDSLGFTMLLELIESRCQEDGEPMDDFADLFGAIVTKPLSKKWVTKEHGYKHIFRFQEQRLFNQLYPVLARFKERDIGLQLIMQSCNLVPISMVQNKLDELLPLLTRANIVQESNSVQVKMNYLYLFRKVLTTQ
jgi:hypothetical protein